MIPQLLTGPNGRPGFILVKPHQAEGLSKPKLALVCECRSTPNLLLLLTSKDIVHMFNTAYNKEVFGPGQSRTVG